MSEGKTNLTKDILLTIVVGGGFLVLACTAPGILKALAPFVKKYRHNSLSPAHIKRRLKQLENQELITVSEQNGTTKIYITKTGRTRVLAYQADEMVITKQDPWDGQWRYVIFDIPESKKVAREVFREKLQQLGFKRIQKSVWKHKYPCEAEIEFLTNLYHITPYISLIEGRSLF